MSLKHVSPHVGLHSQVEGPGGKCACASAFLGTILPRKCSRAGISAYADLGMVVKDDTDVGPAKEAERCESTSPSAALEGGYGGIAMD